MKVRKAKSSAGEDRRTPGIGHTGRVPCRLCKAPTALEAGRVRSRGGFTELPCSRCGLIMRVRRTDGSA
jgi:hypothetical protein